MKHLFLALVALYFVSCKEINPQPSQYSVTYNLTDSLIVKGNLGARNHEAQTLHFDGKGNYAYLENHDLLNPTEAITLSIWFKPKTFEGVGNNPIVQKGYMFYEYPYVQYHLGIIGDTGRYTSQAASFVFDLCINDSLISLRTEKGFWQPDTWYHLCGTYDGTDMILYVNGKVVRKTSVEGRLNTFQEDVYFGRMANRFKYTPGTSKHFFLAHYALSQREVDSLYSQYLN